MVVESGKIQEVIQAILEALGVENPFDGAPDPSGFFGRIRWVIWMLERLSALAVVAADKAESILGAGTGPEKREAACSALADLYFQFANVKVLPDILERLIVKALAGMAIDRIVGVLNSSGVMPEHAEE